MTVRRFGTFVAFSLIWLAAGATAAIADPPGPTDYLSEVTEIEPVVPGVAVEIIGGDSFVLLTIDRGIKVEVVGYSGEPYLRFAVDGTVEENRLSPSKYQNEDRFAITDMPADADAAAAPEWIVVADDGSYAWHDHRTHWMNEMPPPGRSPGDIVAEGVVPLLVDGAEVDVTVVSVWQQPPSPFPVALGFAAGMLIAYAALRRHEQLVPMVTGLALAATATGGIAYFSVPSETAPPWSLWVLPATAALLAVTVLFGRQRTKLVAQQQQTFLLIATLELVGWGVVHWGWLWPSVLPTSLPFWLDRFIASTVLVSALGAAAAVVGAAAAPVRVGRDPV